MPEFDYTPEEFENLVNNVYLGNVSPDSLPLDLYNAINGYLSAGLDLVFGENIVFDVGAPDLKLYQYFKHNVAVFSGAKTYQQARDMSELVFSPDGFKRSFTDFKKDAKKVFDTYNKNWLRTEYDTAVTSAQTATQWNQIAEDAEALPYLKYVTAGDERVRHDHRAWNGITLPVNHKFWDTHYPPNGWNCRCMVVQLDDNDRVRITPEETLDIVPPPDSELFNNNPAKTGVIFDKSHPYFNFKKEHQARASRNFGLPTPEKPAEAITEKIDPIKQKAKEMKPENLKDIFDVETSDEFWSLFKTKPSVKPNLKGDSFARGNSVDLDVNRFTTEYGQKKIIYHEFGHVLHEQLNWNKFSVFDPIVDPRVEEVFNKYKKEFKNTKKNAEKWRHLYYRSEKGKAYIYELQNKYKHLNKADFEEQLSSYLDTIASLTKGRLGGGHELSYWKAGRGYYDKAEFLAHAFENKYVGNELFKGEMPELFNDMVKLLDELINEQTSKL